MINKFVNSPHILLVFSALFWGGNAVAGKYLAASIPPVTISFIRLAISGFIIFPLFFVILRKEWKTARTHLKQLTLLALTGIIGFNLLSYWALNFTSAINGSLLNSTSPLFIFLLSYVLTKERIKIKYILSVLLSIGGVIFIITQGSLDRLISFRFNLGDLIMILAVIMWAIYSLLLKKISLEISPFGVFGYSLGIGFMLMIPIVFVELSIIPLGYISSPEWAALLYLGIFPSVCSFLLWNRAVVLIGAAKASVFLNLIPVFGSVAAFFMLGEVITVAHVVGGSLVFAGIYFSSYTKKSSSILQEKEG
ncbi:hypothetical protein CVD25_11680 [Bacillus canaveralius]|uniref:EamA domain-containing protein n=1 Tax=Bacillus canaveralius TaxID=1403243 RepID=A0A2N5GMP7_9BACI|nr:DMT family transporter [Bacillus canaveralius]PLR83275.1 hypothetical protein CU635_09485 [Bacillus canaveralius]PLR96678.1 hypothetical protein CVD25_11680 [Bacillus canaveralius]RSK55232.1 DMT family transporter [Bacillus canaveralius]